MYRIKAVVDNGANYTTTVTAYKRNQSVFFWFFYYENKANAHVKSLVQVFFVNI